MSNKKYFSPEERKTAAEECKRFWRGVPMDDKSMIERNQQYKTAIYNIPVRPNAAAKARNTAKAKEDFLKAAEMTMGCVREACRKAQISHSSYYNYMREDPEFRRRVEEIREAQKDFVEDALIKKIAEGDTHAILWAAKCLLRERGFNEKNEVDLHIPTEYKLNIGEDEE